MPPLPPTPAAWILSLLGSLALVCSLLFQARMWQVEFGMRSVAAGGGEYMVALFFGAPLLLLSAVLLGSVSSRAPWRSIAGLALLALCLLNLAMWTILFVADSSGRSG